jgi:SNF2 family DNA or RNA helicase
MRPLRSVSKTQRFWLLAVMLLAMRFLTLSRDGTRLTLVVDNTTPLRSAAQAIRGVKAEPVSDGFAVFSYPALPDSCRDVIDTFNPQVSEAAQPIVLRLQAQEQAVAAALAAKGSGAPLVFDPGLRSTPMGHQRDALNFGWQLLRAHQKGCALLMEQGTGKSLVAIGLANGLFLEARTVRWVLVLCPNSLKGTWGSEDGEIAKHSAAAAVTVLRGSRDKRLWQIANLPRTEHLQWIVTNYDQLGEDPRKAEHLRELLHELEKLGPGLLLCDESTALKNPRAHRTRNVHELARRFIHTLILTGTPVTRNPLDVWAQFEVLGEGSLGFPSYLGFERAYALIQKRPAKGGSHHFNAVVGYRNLPDLEARVARLSYRVRAADCLDLPELIVQKIPVELSDEQERLLTSLKNESMALLDSGEAIDGRNVLLRMLRMAQILGGFVHVLGPDGLPAGSRTLTPNPKLDAAAAFLGTVLDDPARKAVCFAQFRAEITALQAMATEQGWAPVVFHGDVPEAERDRGRQQFKTDPARRLMILQYQTGSKGLTLTEADTCLFYSLTFSLEDYLQARKRVHRIGQTRPVTEAYLLADSVNRRGRARKTLDQIILARLQDKQMLADAVTGDARSFREIVEAM